MDRRINDWIAAYTYCNAGLCALNRYMITCVCVQYMSFPVQAPERGSLVPVIAMLLQFNVRELAEAEKALREPIWSTRPVKEVKRSLTRAAQNLPPEPVTESSKEGIRAADEDKS